MSYLDLLLLTTITKGHIFT